jgi:transcription antitermination factor NusG
MFMPSYDTHWFAIQVQPRQEKSVAFQLSAKGYEHFLPIHKCSAVTARQGLGRPMFPGYVFCRFSPQNRQNLVVTTRGVLKIVGSGGVPEPIPDWEIENLQRVTETAAPWGLEVAHHYGSRVRIARGPFTDVEGIFVQIRGKYRVVVQVQILGGGAAIEVQSSDVEPLRMAMPCVVCRTGD